MIHEQAYGLWGMVFVNSAIFIFFAFSFFKPQTKRDWRSFSAFSAFIVALFVEMYGFPLTIYVLSGWLGQRFPQVNLLSHGSGHLWHTLLSWKGDPHTDPLHIASNILIIAGFWTIGSAWKVLYDAQHTKKMATTGAYRYVRHPQYTGFITIMLGFLLQWPTIPTLIMFPVLVLMYVRLAHREEREVTTEFGEPYRIYVKRTPAFIPRIGDIFGANKGSHSDAHGHSA